jgi:hypothetical protein
MQKGLFLSPLEREKVLRETLQTYKSFFIKVESLSGTYFIYEEVLINLEPYYSELSHIVTEAYVLNCQHYLSDETLYKRLNWEQYHLILKNCAAYEF